MKTKRNEEIVRRRQQGQTCSQIAELFGITEARVSQICREWLDRHDRAEASAENPEHSLYYLMTNQFAMTRADGKTSHVPGAAYITIRRYWEGKHPGTIPTVDDLCAMTEKEISSVPYLGRAMKEYIRTVKMKVIKMNAQAQMKELSSGTGLIKAPPGDGASAAHLRMAVYVRIEEDSTRSIAAIKIIKQEQSSAAFRLTEQTPSAIYMDQGSDRAALNQLLSECRAGKYDLIYTKSVRRFTGSFAETDQIAEELKALDPPVDIFFAEFSRYTLNEKSEEAWRQFLALIEDED